MCLLFPPRLHAAWAGSKQCLLEQMLVFILGKNPFLKTSSFKELSWIYTIRNSMHIKIFGKTTSFPSSAHAAQVLWILPCHCGKGGAVTTPDSLLVLLLLLPDMGMLSYGSDRQKNNFPWGPSAKNQLTPQAFAHRLFWTFIVLQEHSTFECLSPNPVKRCYRLRGGKEGKRTHLCNVTVWAIKEKISYVICVFFSCYLLPLCFKQEKLLFLK